MGQKKIEEKVEEAKRGKDSLGYQLLNYHKYIIPKCP